MTKLREVLRLTHERLSVRQVCEVVGKTAVCEYVNRARVIGITPERNCYERRPLAACAASLFGLYAAAGVNGKIEMTNPANPGRGTSPAADLLQFFAKTLIVAAVFFGRAVPHERAIDFSREVGFVEVHHLIAR